MRGSRVLETEEDILGVLVVHVYGPIIEQIVQDCFPVPVKESHLYQ